MKAWIENGKIRDACRSGNPAECYHPDIAKLYTIEVPDNADNGDEWVNGKLVKPAAPPPAPVPAKTWTVTQVRAGLKLPERVKWDNDKTDTIRTAKVEFEAPRTLADATEVLQMLVDAGDISAASMSAILKA